VSRAPGRQPLPAILDAVKQALLQSLVRQVQRLGLGDVVEDRDWGLLVRARPRRWGR